MTGAGVQSSSTNFAESPGDAFASQVALLLTLLVAGDLLWIGLHVINARTNLIGNPLLWIDRDRTYPEIYQYLKWMWTVVALLVVTVRTPGYGTWALVFTYVMLDDAFSVHEQVGHTVAQAMPFATFLGMQRQDLGEATVSAGAAAVLLCAVAWAYARSSGSFREASRDVLVLLAFFSLFAVGFDILHGVAPRGSTTHFALGVLEDGGEMLVASVITWYVFFRTTAAVQGGHRLTVLLAIARNGLHITRRR